MCEETSGKSVLSMANPLNVKDSRWLQLEVCREFQRGQCSRTDTECKFAHPPAHVEVQNGRVTACYDSIKSRCQRENPKCKYLHPPQHLKDQLQANGRSALMIKNYMQTIQFGNPVVAPTAAVMNPLAVSQASFQLPGVTAYPSYFALNTQLFPGIFTSPEAAAALQASAILPSMNANGPSVSVGGGIVPQMPKMARSDRIEVCRQFLRGTCSRSETDCKFAHPGPEVEKLSDGTVTVCMDFVRMGGSCNRQNCRYFHPPSHLLASLKGCANRMSATSPLGLQQSQVTSAAAANGLSLVQAMNGNSQMNAALAELNSLSGHNSNVSAQSISPLHASAVPSLPVSHAAALSAAAMMAAASSHLAVSKKRPLEDSAGTGASSTESLLLAAAALQPSFKRIATTSDKSGLPVYQPVTTFQYPQFATYHPFQLTAGTALQPIGAAAFSPVAAAANFSSCGAEISPSGSGALVASNAASVAYFDESGQLLDTLPVCRDFKQSQCDRPNCRYVHLSEDYVEVSSEGKVTVCRDFAKGRCSRHMCKYYHVPILHSSFLNRVAGNDLLGVQQLANAQSSMITAPPHHSASASSSVLSPYFGSPVSALSLPCASFSLSGSQSNNFLFNLNPTAGQTPPPPTLIGQQTCLDPTTVALLLAAQRQQHQAALQYFQAAASSASANDILG